MPITYQKRTAQLQENVGVEEAEGLFDWLLKNPKGKLNLGNCQHLHSANLQVMMVLRPDVSVWPTDQELKSWLMAAMNSNGE